MQQYIFILAKTNYTKHFLLLSIIFLWSYNSFILYAHTRKYKLFFNFPNTNNTRRFYGQHYHLYVYFFILLLLLSCHYRSPKRSQTKSNSNHSIVSFIPFGYKSIRILSKASNSDKVSIRAFNSAPPHH